MANGLCIYIFDYLTVSVCLSVYLIPYYFPCLSVNLSTVKCHSLYVCFFFCVFLFFVFFSLVISVISVCSCVCALFIFQSHLFVWYTCFFFYRAFKLQFHGYVGRLSHYLIHMVEVHTQQLSTGYANGFFQCSFLFLFPLFILSPFLDSLSILNCTRLSQLDVFMNPSQESKVQ